MRNGSSAKAAVSWLRPPEGDSAAPIAISISRARAIVDFDTCSGRNGSIRSGPFGALRICVDILTTTHAYIEKSNETERPTNLEQPAESGDPIVTDPVRVPPIQWRSDRTEATACSGFTAAAGDLGLPPNLGKTKKVVAEDASIPSVVIKATTGCANARRDRVMNPDLLAERRLPRSPLGTRLTRAQRDPSRAKSSSSDRETNAYVDSIDRFVPFSFDVTNWLSLEDPISLLGHFEEETTRPEVTPR